MIAVLVTFENARNLSLEETIARAETTSPTYRNLEHLIAKSYLYREDGKLLGGFYHWESKAAAEAWYTDEWRARVVEANGVEPTVQYFEVTAQINNRELSASPAR